jgi:hypothetical protein
MTDRFLVTGSKFDRILFTKQAGNRAKLHTDRLFLVLDIGGPASTRFGMLVRLPASTAWLRFRSRYPGTFPRTQLFDARACAFGWRC